MSQLVRLEGKHTTQNAHCALPVVAVETNMNYSNDLVWHNIFSVDRIRKKKIVSIFE